MERGALLRYCFIFSVMLGAAGRAALNKLKSMEYQSKIFWKLINSSLKVGLAQHKSTPFLQGGKVGGGCTGDTELDLCRVSQAGSALQLDREREGASHLCEQDDLTELPMRGYGQAGRPSRVPAASRSYSPFTGGFARAARIRARQDRARLQNPPAQDEQQPAFMATTPAVRGRAGRAAAGARRAGGKAEITYSSRKYLPAKGRSLHEMQKLQECDALVV